MKDLLHDRISAKANVTRELAATLRTSLDRKYNQVLGAAAARWDQKFAGKDPSDACVSVRISSRSLSHQLDQAA